MKFTIFCFLTLNIVLYTDSSTFRCDYEYFENIDGFLKFHEIPANWQEARLRCHLEGAKLASPLNDELQLEIRNLMKRKCSKCTVHTGIHATFSRGDFASVEGVPLSAIYHTWAKGEPDAYQNDEDCIAMLSDGTIADVKCKIAFPYLCFKKWHKSLHFNYSCGTTDPGYTYDSRTGSCYRFHRSKRTWSRAYMTCMAEGGYLAIINSDAEAQIIKELFKENMYHSEAFIGFHDWGEHGEWVTIKGDSLEVAGYNKFAPKQPDNATDGEFCGSVFKSGLLNDLWCDKKYGFICEKNPKTLACPEIDTRSRQDDSQ